MKRIFTAALIATSSVSALSISSTCQTALAGVAANNDANACLSASSLLTLVLQSNSSIITPVDTWLKTLCAAAPCSNDTLSAVVSNVTAGCSTELSGADSSTFLPLVQQYYPTVRKVVCLTDSGTNCVTQTLTNVQAILGTLSLDNVGGVIEKAVTTTASSIPSNVTCTNCIKEAFNIVNADFPSMASSASSAIQSECGADFIDGKSPSGIVQSATTTGGGSNSASATAMIMTRGALAGLTASVLVLGSSLWAFLA
ncbi:hypothetical protein C8R43DRAFT_457182 [Mycena crocata]|nr:hypothetical protein C8R43DRAFT_457182 [Mycena crocata]